MTIASEMLFTSMSLNMWLAKEKRHEKAYIHLAINESVKKSCDSKLKDEQDEAVRQLVLEKDVFYGIWKILILLLSYCSIKEQ